MTVEFSDIKAAAERIKGQAIRTPVIESHALEEKTGARVLIKPESLQRTGSFKFRGAYNRLAQLTSDQRNAGVVAWSSGNHAQGVAAAAEVLDVHATIIMPSDAPKVKAENTRAYGAEIITYNRYTENREDIGRQLARDRGAVLVPSYDDADVIAGQGTCGLEFAQQCAELGASVDTLLVCCGGGGLVAGSTLGFKEFHPGADVYAVEPADFDDHVRSLESGKREQIDPAARSICDALLSPEPGALTFPLNKQNLAGAMSVTDDEVRTAMRFAFAHLKLVVEPGGAVALAAALSGKLPLAGKTIGVVISGGNVDVDLFAEIVTKRH